MKKQKVSLNDSFNPIILRNVLARHWYKPLLIAFFIFALIFIYLRYTKPTYESKAVLQIIQENKTQKILGDDAIAPNNRSLSEEVELLRSPILFRDAFQSLNLNIFVYNYGQLLTENLYGYTPFSIITNNLIDSGLCATKIYIEPTNSNDFILNYTYKDVAYKVNATLSSPITTKHFIITLNSNDQKGFSALIRRGKIFFTFLQQHEILNELQSGLQVSIMDENAKTIQLSFRHQNKKLAFAMMKAIVNSYFYFEKIRKQEDNINTLTFIDNQLDSLSIVLNGSKDSLSQFQRSQNLPSIEYEENDLTTNLSELNRKNADINDELYAIDYAKKTISEQVTRPEIFKILPELVGKKSFEGSITRQIDELKRLLETKEDLMQDISYESNKVRLTNDRISSCVQGIQKSMASIQERLRHEKRIIENQLSNYESRLMGLPEKTSEFNRLKYMDELNRNYFNKFTEKKIEFQLSNAGYTNTNRLLSLPNMPVNPVSPKRNQAIIIGCVLTFLFGIGILLFYYLFYNEITSLNDLKSLLPETATILGTVPLHRKKMIYSQVVVIDSPKSRLSESVRNIKSNMTFINKNAKTVAISSSVSGEGKTFVILNLAATFSNSGSRCILLDLDLRKPKVHHGFGIENDKGMSQVLSGLIPYEEAIQSSEIPNLDFITAGPIPPNPSDLIQSQALNDLIETLKMSYDLVFIDNPPIGVVSDGIKILTQADIPIYVFKANYSKRVFADQILNLFNIQKIDKINVILNAIPTGRGLYGYG
ncbi:MAG: polysaccharide biosynthesis tyrosine autokinase, partial [Flavobacteriales bacterium]|nr:polysaccharide biosynthesis tyrosine autokinase [Flavobacteriales bacterium]